MIKTPDFPRNESCKLVNPTLFLYFQKKYFSLQHAFPTEIWTEANVVQWLDLEENKYIHEYMDENIR